MSRVPTAHYDPTGSFDVTEDVWDLIFYWLAIAIVGAITFCTVFGASIWYLWH